MFLERKEKERTVKGLDRTNLSNKVLKPSANAGVHVIILIPSSIWQYVTLRNSIDDNLWKKTINNYQAWFVLLNAGIQTCLRSKQDKWVEEKDRKTENVIPVSDACCSLQEANRAHRLSFTYELVLHHLLCISYCFSLTFPANVAVISLQITS